MEQRVSQHRHMQEAQARIRSILDKQALIRGLATKSAGPRQDLVQDLVARQQLNALRRELEQMHPADIAYVLEGLPLDERRLLWSLLEPRAVGAVLLEVADAVRETLIEHTDRATLVDAAGHLESDEIADLMADLPNDLVPEVLGGLAPRNRAQVQSALAFPEDTVGALMEFDFAVVRDDVTLDVVLRYLRRRGSLPQAMNELMVVDRAGLLRGTLGLETLLTTEVDVPVREVMRRESLVFHTTDPIGEAATAFERYDLISAPVLNVHDQLVGVLKVEAVLDHLQDVGQRDLLSQAGLKENEDLFAPVSRSARNRGFWLALNLVTAFISSRVIGQFEDTIVQVVALAALMPIVAAVGGNAGNQTLALVIRAYALDQIGEASYRRLLRKELAVGGVNGLVWGGVMALVTLLLYQSPVLAGVMLAAMVITLSFASLAGVLTPALLRRFGQDPAYGSSIVLTGVTDSLGFFVFLGLAALLLG